MLDLHSVGNCNFFVFNIQINKLFFVVNNGEKTCCIIFLLCFPCIFYVKSMLFEIVCDLHFSNYWLVDIIKLCCIEPCDLNKSCESEFRNA